MSYADRRKFLWIVFLVGLALIAVAANATTLARMHFSDLAHQASAIARLRCVSTESRWDSGEIWTETKFIVVEQNKGNLPGVVTVRLMGGKAGHLRSRVEGVPEFRAGEEVYLFLWEKSRESYSVLGWAQGTFRITRDAGTGLERVTQDSASTAIFDPRTHEFRREGIRNLPVPVFQLKLRRAIEQENR